jgi:hypothetical protein
MDFLASGLGSVAVLIAGTIWRRRKLQGMETAG